MMELRTIERTKKKPKPIDKDSRGVSIEIGHKVAYNFSGNVVIGYIISIDNIKWIKGKPKDWYTWTCNFKIKIENEEGHISTIKNPNSFIII